MVGLSPIEQMPVIMLLVTIAVLFAISYLVTDASLKGTREVSFEIKSDSLDKQYLFWLGIIVPIGIFFYLEYFVFLSNEINFDSGGFSVFFNESKLPLGVLALSPIFGVIVSNIHRTIQTEKQIQVTEIKNISDSFYSHKKYIIEEFNTIKVAHEIIENDIIIELPNKLYKKLYHKSTVANGFNESIDQDYLQSLKNKLNELNNVIQSMATKTKENNYIGNSIINDFLKNKYIELESVVKEIARAVGLNDEVNLILKNKLKKLKEKIKKEEEKYEHEKHLQHGLNEYLDCFFAKEVLGNSFLVTLIILNIFNRVFDIVDVHLEHHKTIKDDMRSNLLPIFNVISNECDKLYKPISEYEEIKMRDQDLNAKP
ncbi:hypothetical protein [Providencia sp. PROV223]|uniref:hypothetical protein n=1 Tax=Providencia sp. PROV223 TaxID=2949917 RepID=UPI00234990D3|nr:hypothetical protein [Providencia sp. PROV223]